MKGSQAILSFFLKIGDDMQTPDNKFFEDLDIANWNFSEGKAYTSMKKPSLNSLVNGGLTSYYQKNFFWYMGSESIPPCREHVFRIVMKSPIKIPKFQFDEAKQHFYHSDIESNGNSRAPRSMLNRMVYSHSDTSIPCSKIPEEYSHLPSIGEDDDPRNEEERKKSGKFMKAESNLYTYGVTLDDQDVDYELSNGMRVKTVKKNEIPLDIQRNLMEKGMAERTRIERSTVKKYSLEGKYTKKEEYVSVL